MQPFTQAPISRILRTYCSWPGDNRDSQAAARNGRATVWGWLPSAWLYALTQGWPLMVRGPAGRYGIVNYRPPHNLYSVSHDWKLCENSSLTM